MNDRRPRYWNACEVHAGFEWTQWEEGGFWESEAGYVEDGLGQWFAFPNISPDARLEGRGPHPTREAAMQATADAFRKGYWQDGEE